MYDKTHIFLSCEDLYRPALGYDLSYIAQLYRLVRCFVGLHAKVLQSLWVEASARTELGEVIFQLLNGRRNLRFEVGEIEGILSGGGTGRGLFLISR
jgi:hypothetical protein